MDYTFIHRTEAWVLCTLLFSGMLVMILLGRWVRNFWREEIEEARGGINTLQVGLYGLYAFMLAFVFGMSGNRYDSVRKLIEQEANEISSALIQSDLYSDSIRTAFRLDFKDYTQARIILYARPGDRADMDEKKKHMQEVGTRIWARAAEQSKLPNMIVPSNLMLRSLNEMLDVADAREVELRTIVPDIVVYMMFILALVNSFISGFTSSRVNSKDWVLIISFALLASMVTYVTLDLGRPVRGLIKSDASEQAIMDLKNLFSEDEWYNKHGK